MDDDDEIAQAEEDMRRVMGGDRYEESEEEEESEGEGEEEEEEVNEDYYFSQDSDERAEAQTMVDEFLGGGEAAEDVDDKQSSSGKSSDDVQFVRRVAPPKSKSRKKTVVIHDSSSESSSSSSSSSEEEEEAEEEEPPPVSSSAASYYARETQHLFNPNVEAESMSALSLQASQGNKAEDNGSDSDWFELEEVKQPMAEHAIEPQDEEMYDEPKSSSAEVYPASRRPGRKLLNKKRKFSPMPRDFEEDEYPRYDEVPSKKHRAPSPAWTSAAAAAASSSSSSAAAAAAPPSVPVEKSRHKEPRTDEHEHREHKHDPEKKETRHFSKRYAPGRRQPSTHEIRHMQMDYGEDDGFDQGYRRGVRHHKNKQGKQGVEPGRSYAYKLGYEYGYKNGKVESKTDEERESKTKDQVTFDRGMKQAEEEWTASRSFSHLYDEKSKAFIDGYNYAYRTTLVKFGRQCALKGYSMESIPAEFTKDKYFQSGYYNVMAAYGKLAAHEGGESENLDYIALRDPRAKKHYNAGADEATRTAAASSAASSAASAEASQNMPLDFESLYKMHEKHSVHKKGKSRFKAEMRTLADDIKKGKNKFKAEMHTLEDDVKKDVQKLKGHYMRNRFDKTDEFHAYVGTLTREELVKILSQMEDDLVQLIVESSAETSEKKKKNKMKGDTTMRPKLRKNQTYDVLVTFPPPELEERYEKKWLNILHDPEFDVHKYDTNEHFKNIPVVEEHPEKKEYVVIIPRSIYLQLIVNKFYGAKMGVHPMFALDSAGLVNERVHRFRKVGDDLRCIFFCKDGPLVATVSEKNDPEFGEENLKVVMQTDYSYFRLLAVDPPKYEHKKHASSRGTEAKTSKEKKEGAMVVDEDEYEEDDMEEVDITGASAASATEDVFPFEQLPVEVVRHVVFYLDLKDIAQLKNVTKQLYILFNNPKTYLLADHRPLHLHMDQKFSNMFSNPLSETSFEKYQVMCNNRDRGFDPNGRVLAKSLRVGNYMDTTLFRYALKVATNIQKIDILRRCLRTTYNGKFVKEYLRMIMETQTFHVEKMSDTEETKNKILPGRIYINHEVLNAFHLYVAHRDGKECALSIYYQLGKQVGFPAGENTGNACNLPEAELTTYRETLRKCAKESARMFKDNLPTFKGIMQTFRFTKKEILDRHRHRPDFFLLLFMENSHTNKSTNLPVIQWILPQYEIDRDDMGITQNIAHLSQYGRANPDDNPFRKLTNLCSLETLTWIFEYYKITKEDILLNYGNMLDPLVNGLAVYNDIDITMAIRYPKVRRVIELIGLNEADVTDLRTPVKEILRLLIRIKDEDVLKQQLPRYISLLR